MANISTYASDKLLGHSVGQGAYTMPAVYVALFTTTPTMPAGTGGVEVTGGAYARQPTSGVWGAPAAESINNSSPINFPTATAAWGTVVGCGLFDALTSGNLLWAGPLAASQVIGIGGQFQFAIGALVVGLT